MIQDIPWQLLEKHFAKTTNEFEEKQVLEWIETAPENAMIYTQLQAHYYQTGSLPVEFVPDTYVALNKVNAKLGEKKVFRLSPVWYAAAVSIIFMVAYFGVFKPNHHQSNSLLTLNSPDSTTTTVLADGTKVWLNASSTLQFPAKFAATREVSLTGEGYFEVAHDPEHPFVVQTGTNIIKVLGTKFDIRSYSSEKNVLVSVTEGRVSFGNQQGQHMILQLGQQCIYHSLDNIFEPISVLDPNMVAWKTKEFIFDNKSLITVFQTLAPVYHCDYKFMNEILKNRKITTQFKALSLNEIVAIIAIATNTEITMQREHNKPIVIIK